MSFNFPPPPPPKQKEPPKEFNFPTPPPPKQKEEPKQFNFPVPESNEIAYRYTSKEAESLFSRAGKRTFEEAMELLSNVERIMAGEDIIASLQEKYADKEKKMKPDLNTLNEVIRVVEKKVANKKDEDYFNEELGKAEAGGNEDKIRGLKIALDVFRAMTAPRPWGEGSLIHLPPEGKAIAIGDIHGHPDCLRKILDESKAIERIKSGEKLFLVFLGDYIDRAKPADSGDAAVLEAILELKHRFADNVILLMGNHETMHVKFSAANLEEVKKEFDKRGATVESEQRITNGWIIRWKDRETGERAMRLALEKPGGGVDVFGESSSPHDFPESMGKHFQDKGGDAYGRYMQFFKTLPIAAVSHNGVLLLHAGIAKGMESVKDLVNPTPEVEFQVLWNDPWDCWHLPNGAKFALSDRDGRRGTIFYFSEAAVSEFFAKAGLKALVRSHQQQNLVWNLLASLTSTDYDTPNIAYLEFDLKKEIADAKDLDPGLKEIASWH